MEKPGNTKKHGNTLEQPAKTLEKTWENQTKMEQQKKKNTRKTKTTKKTIFLDSLEGGGPSQDSLRIVFFWFFQCFFGFGHFQPFAPFCTLAVRCLHAFKLAGTHRLTTAAMNILGLWIKTACSNFEMFSHVLDNNLSFMLYFLKSMLHKLVAHFAEVIRPSSQALLYCIIDGICCRLMLHFLGGMLHRFAKKLFTFKSRYTYTRRTYTYVYIYIHIQCVHLQRKAFLD